MKDTFYFPHDFNTRTDIKIKNLILKYGLLGYGIFWAIVEDLYNNANAMRLDYELIAFDLREDVEIIKSIINDFGLFKIKNEILSSSSVGQRLKERKEKTVKARESAKSRWNKYERNTDAMQTQSEGNAIKERKGKEKKIKESKEGSPHPNLIFSFFASQGKPPEMAQKFYDFYKKRNWQTQTGNLIDWEEKAQKWIDTEIEKFVPKKEPSRPYINARDLIKRPNAKQLEDMNPLPKN